MIWLSTNGWSAASRDQARRFTPSSGQPVGLTLPSAPNESCIEHSRTVEAVEAGGSTFDGRDDPLEQPANRIAARVAASAARTSGYSPKSRKMRRVGRPVDL